MLHHGAGPSCRHQIRDVVGETTRPGNHEERPLAQHHLERLGSGDLPPAYQHRHRRSPSGELIGQ
ncbi:MAG TPA: hypothetical protein VK988_01190 [Acidimicrobiales bacterium]|nr:hypothetical protein [Acidimicrobiales bacterium]